VAAVLGEECAGHAAILACNDLRPVRRNEAPFAIALGVDSVRHFRGEAAAGVDDKWYSCSFAYIRNVIFPISACGVADRSMRKAVGLVGATFFEHALGV
jgi:hypothetical protein